MEAGLREIRLPFIQSAGNFIAVDFGREALPIYEALLREGVIVRPFGVCHAHLAACFCRSAGTECPFSVEL